MSCLRRVFHEKHVSEENWCMEQQKYTCSSVGLDVHNISFMLLAFAPTECARYMQLTWDLFRTRLDEFTAEAFSGFTSLVDKTKGY